MDLRSDTITRPGPDMRRAIADAAVGDDVFGDDPTVLELQRRVAALFDKPAAMFVPSGTMANQLAVRSQTAPGDQVLLEAGAHIYRYEAGAPAALSGVQLTPIVGDGGQLTWADVDAAIHPDDPHCAAPSMLCLENTHNQSGGRVLPKSRFDELTAGARQRGLSIHLDGARLWNAVAATGVAPAAWAASVDTVSVCLSKGLGAPVGSMLIGSTEVIRAAHRARKQWGGGMRQAGLLAAAGLYALDHHLDRLEEDHANAARMAELIEHPQLRLHVAPETNILLYQVQSPATAADWIEALSSHDVQASSMGPQLLRFVTHLDVSRADCERAAEIVNGVTIPSA